MANKFDPAVLLNSDRLTLMGVPGSPYTRKMLAVLRYRQLAYRLILGSNVAGGEVQGLPMPKVSLLPTFFLRNAAGALEAVTDSTPLIRRPSPTSSAGPPNTQGHTASTRSPRRLVRKNSTI